MTQTLGDKFKALTEKVPQYVFDKSDEDLHKLVFDSFTEACKRYLENCVKNEKFPEPMYLDDENIIYRMAFQDFYKDSRRRLISSFFNNYVYAHTEHCEHEYDYLVPPFLAFVNEMKEEGITVKLTVFQKEEPLNDIIKGKDDCVYIYDDEMIMRFSVKMEFLF